MDTEHPFSVRHESEHISVYSSSLFVDPETEEELRDTATASVSVDDFMRGIASARQGGTSRLKTSDRYQQNSFIVIDPGRISLGMQYLSDSFTIPRSFNFDRLFLDTFSVIENSELRKRTSRDIRLGPAEEALVELVSRSPELLYGFSRRAFEVFVGSFLAKAGFANIRLSRFVKDGGYDMYAVTFDGEQRYSVVVEVKHYTRTKVGLEIVDRLNGVRCREGADAGMIFTTSSFSADARKHYLFANQPISLIDYHRLVELLQESPGQWTSSKSDLWSLPRRIDGQS
jgi:hypothetical protein